MDVRSLARPTAHLLKLSSTSTQAATSTQSACSSLLLSLPFRTRPLISSRGHKTTARTKRSLKIAPHDSFLPDRTAPFPAVDSIIYNPPSSEASPAHTPFIFLPSNDARRAALQQARSNPGAPSPAGAIAVASDKHLPPEMQYMRRDPKYTLTAKHVEEMRRLRNADPLKWSAGALAKKFQCSHIFVRMAAPAPKEHLEWVKEKLERKRARWGPIRTRAREERKQRNELLHRGQL